MAKQPPENKALDPKVLARRQKDLDGYVDKYDAVLDARDVRYAAELKKTYTKIGLSLNSEMGKLYREIQRLNGAPVTVKPVSPEKLRSMERELERLRTLQAQVMQIVTAQGIDKSMERDLVYTYTDAYYFSAFGLEQSARVGVNVPILTQAHVMGVIANPWLPDGKTYSDRIRANTALLALKMKDNLTEAVGKGWGWNKLAHKITETTGESYNRAVALARTERTRAAGQGANQLYMQNADIMDGKRWNATLDAKTAPKDAANDGKLYELDYDTPENPGRPGERIPNHTNCRCKWSPVLSALGVSTRERIARDANNKRIYTKARTYREYAKEQGLPDLDERLSRDDPRKYLRRGESASALTIPKVVTTASVAATAVAVPEVVQQIKDKVAQGVVTETQARDVGQLVRKRVDELYTPEQWAVMQVAGDLSNLRAKAFAEMEAVKKKHAKAMKAGDYAKADEYGELYGELAHRYNNETLPQWRDAWQRHKVNRRKVVAEALREIRPLGNPGRQAWDPGSEKSVIEAQEHMAQYLPSSWLTASNATPMRAINTGRGFYRQAFRNDPATFSLSGGSAENMQRVAVHEMGHRVENVVPGIMALEHEFYQRRTKGDKLKWLGKGHRRDEKTRFDKFLEPYMGKDYGNRPDSYYEILSMGLESIFGGRVTHIENDQDYYDFILGVLAAK